MFLDALPIARDIAVILLVLQWLVIAAVPLFILIKITSGLRSLLPKVRPGLQQLHRQIKRLLGGIERAMELVRAPFVWVTKTRAALQTRLERFSLAWRR